MKRYRLACLTSCLCLLAAANLAAAAATEADDVQTLALPEPMPSIPADQALLRYETSPRSNNRFWIDPASIDVRQSVVRLTAIVESASGVRNIAFMAFDCALDRHALLASRHSDQSWHPARAINWRAVSGVTGMNTPHLRAVHRAVCEGGGPARTPAIMLERLRDPRDGELAH